MIFYGKARSLREAIFARDGVCSETRTVTTPALVVAGQEDVSTPVR